MNRIDVTLGLEICYDDYRNTLKSVHSKMVLHTGCRAQGPLAPVYRRFILKSRDNRLPELCKPGSSVGILWL